MSSASCRTASRSECRPRSSNPRPAGWRASAAAARSSRSAWTWSTTAGRSGSASPAPRERRRSCAPSSGCRNAASQGARALARRHPAGSRPRNSASGADRGGHLLDLVDLALPVLHEIVIALHDVLHLLAVGFAHALAGHHVFERLHVLDLELHDRHPVALADEVGHDPHLPLAALLHHPRHGQRLLDHLADLARLAVHDLANEQHRAPPVPSGPHTASVVTP